MERGLFITFEGSEGCGKTTQIDRLLQRLTASGREVIRTREPGGTPIGEAIRHLLKFAPEGRGMSPECEILLFEASRAQLVRELIFPALLRGAIVVSDRFSDSTTVYQGIARRISSETVGHLNTFAVGEALPDITFLMDLDSDEGLRRMTKRQGSPSPDRMEQESGTFYQSVRDGYLALAKKEPERIIPIDGGLAPDAIETLIWSHLTHRFHGIFEKYSA